MKIAETCILDISEDVAKEKVALANDVIKLVGPILREDFLLRSKRIREVKKEIVLVKKQLQETKNALETIAKEYKRRKKVREILQWIEKLPLKSVSKSLRNELVVLLKVVETMSEDKLDRYLARTRSFATKN